MRMKIYATSLVSVLLLLSFVGCGGESKSETAPAQVDAKYLVSYKGLDFYKQNTPASSYKLVGLSDSEFNNYDALTKLKIANKLLSTLYFSYPLTQLQNRIDAGNFMSTIQKQLTQNLNDKSWIENEILDGEKYKHYSGGEQEAVDILTRFYVMPQLDKYFFHNWIAYTLTQTIMFSPAYELDSSYSPNIANVYTRIVKMLEEEAGMRYISYLHMMSEDNWRRFRSPEDNGREMLEIFTLDEDDTSVLKAGKALQNWTLNRDSDTLVLTLNENHEPLSLFNTTIYNGDDFYREMVKSNDFTYGVSLRLIDYFFTDASSTEKTALVSSLVASHPETFQDILKQIIFSKEYLLHSARAKSAEETFFSLSKKMQYGVNNYTVRSFKNALESMQQASMKYKLGKLTRVPLDTLAFANYHKFIRESVLLYRKTATSTDSYSSYKQQGWSDSFLDDSNFMYDQNNQIESLKSMIHSIFVAILSREPQADEMEMFMNHMLRNNNGVLEIDYTFNIFHTTNPQGYKANVAFIVLDYISRLGELYTFEEVK